LVGLGNSFESQAKHLIRTYRDGIYGTGQKAHLEAACCVFLVARHNNRPLTITEVAKAVPTELSKLGSILRKVAKKLGFQESTLHLSSEQYSSFIERLCRDTIISSLNEREVCDLAEKFVKIAEQDSLITGRKPAAIYSAALILAFEVKGEKPQIYIKQCAASLQIGESTIKNRIKELKRLLVKIGKSLPWGSSIKESTIIKHIPKVLELYDLQQKLSNKQSQKFPQTIPPLTVPSSPLSPGLLGKRKDPFSPDDERRHISCDPSLESIQVLNDPVVTGIPTDPQSLRTLPPAYIKAVALREKRRQKLINASKHLDNLLNGNHSILSTNKTNTTKENNCTQDFDTEDLVLQKLLLAGIPPHLLLSVPIRSLQEYSQGIPLLRSHGLDINSSELSEKDITDQEISSLLNTPEEMHFLEMMEKKLENIQK